MLKEETVVSSKVHRIDVHRVEPLHRSRSLLLVLIFILAFAIWSGLLFRPS